MADYTGQEYINMQKAEEAKQSNIRFLWQETGDLMYPYVQITTTYQNGIPRTQGIYDMTPYLDMCDMVSGLKQILIPSGQPFFAMKTSDYRNVSENAQRYTSMVTEVAHEKIYNSNFTTEFDENLRNLIVFGPGTIYPEWIRGIGLNFKTMEIGTCQYIEDDSKNINSIFVKFRLTARNAVNEFGRNVGTNVLKAADKCETENESFWFIHSVRPRRKRNLNLSNDYNLNMEYESIFINIVDIKIVEESGYTDFPYPTARWMRPGSEKDGRGIGTEMLPQIRVLNKLTKDFIQLSNRHADPAYEKLSEVDGDLDTRPHAVNVVERIGSFKAIDSGINGNFPVSEKTLDRQTALIDRAFFRDAFSPLENLTGDRRTTLEIRERIKQSWHKIGPPISRVWYEQLSKCITRSIILLIKNREIPYPEEYGAPELVGQGFGIEFVGPFALELRSQQAKAFQEWVGWVGNIDTTFPDEINKAVDCVDIDDAVMRMGRTLGVNVEDMSTEEQRNAKRESRMQMMAEQQQMLAMQTQAEAYSKGTKAPEKGSMSE